MAAKFLAKKHLSNWGTILISAFNLLKQIVFDSLEMPL